MKENGIDKKEKKRINFGLLLVPMMLVAAAIGLHGGKKALVQNARIMGGSLAQSYAAEEEGHLVIYETLIETGLRYLDRMPEELDAAEAEQWFSDIYTTAKKATGDLDIRAYVIANGSLTILGEGPEFQKEEITGSQWYQNALEARGRVTFTNVPCQGTDNGQVLMIAAVNPENGDMLAFRLHPEDFEKFHHNQRIMDGGAYYVIDGEGNILYEDITVSAVAREDIMEEILPQILSGSLGENENVFRIKGQGEVGAYYCENAYGWHSVLIIPLSRLVKNRLSSLFFLYGAIIAVFFAAQLISLYRERRITKSLGHANDIIHALKDAYYALYWVDLEKGDYESTKSSPEVAGLLPDHGKYELLLECLCELMDESTKQEFKEAFSLEHIRQLGREKTSHFGGDYLRRFEDKSCWVNVSLLFDEALVGNVGVLCFRVVEEQRQRQLQHTQLLEEALAAAEASQESKMQFFSGMSHDMRTPLNVIIGMSDLALRPDCAPERIKDYLRKINLSSRQLLVLINDLLEVSRLNYGQWVFNRREFNMRQALEEFTLPFKEQARQEEKELCVEMSLPDPVVYGDPDRLMQILNNLVSNAFKFTRSGDRISLTFCQADKGQKNIHYVFIVEDTGIGMSEEFLPKLFEPYARENRFSAQNVTGTGLGMAIVKSIVERKGGQISVESREGKGTRFVITLPYEPRTVEAIEGRQDEGSTAEAGQSSGREEERAQETASKDCLRGKHILLAEDNYLNMEIALEILEAYEVQVTPASNGLEAVERFEGSEPFFFDAVLMDMQMPQMDGCQAARAIRELERPDARTVPIIALTANAFAEDVTRTTQAGMNAHLSKPFDVKQLVATLCRLCGEK